MTRDVGGQLGFDWETAVQPPTSHNVYFIEAISTGLVKIGWTSDLEQRLYALRKGSPVELRLVKCIPGDRSLESALHRRFRAHRVRGEWFLLDALRPHIEDVCASNVPMVPTCCDCGVVLKRDRGLRCRVCSGRHRSQAARAAAAHRAKCRECGRPLSLRSVLKGKSSGFCRSCGMRSAWASSAYQASIMAARAAAGVRRRRKCERCGEPLRSRGRAKFHPECWAALSGPRVDVRQQPLHGVA
jgi:hypothetical protein